MQNLDNNTILALIGAFILGFIIALIILKASSSDAKKARTLKKELEQTKEDLTKQNKTLETHFEQSAVILQDMAQNYKKLCQHLAQGSTDLVPELQLQNRFGSDLLLEKSDTPTEVNTTDDAKVDTSDEKNVATDTTSTNETQDKADDEIKENKDMPKDYSEGSSGLFKGETK